MRHVFLFPSDNWHVYTVKTNPTILRQKPCQKSRDQMTSERVGYFWEKLNLDAAGLLRDNHGPFSP